MKMRARFWHNRSAAVLDPSPCAHHSESRENWKIENLKITNKPTKKAGLRHTCRFEVMRQGTHMGRSK